MAKPHLHDDNVKVLAKYKNLLGYELIEDLEFASPLITNLAVNTYLLKINVQLLDEELSRERQLAFNLNKALKLSNRQSSVVQKLRTRITQCKKDLRTRRIIVNRIVKELKGILR
jgi:hypothetical protein